MSPEHERLLSFETQWEEYTRKVYPQGMNPYQEKQIRRAFIAGGWIAMQMMKAISVLPEIEAEARLEVAYKELERLMTGELTASFPRG